jgi:hypothetical protein
MKLPLKATPCSSSVSRTPNQSPVATEPFHQSLKREGASSPACMGGQRITAQIASPAQYRFFPVSTGKGVANVGHRVEIFDVGIVPLGENPSGLSGANLKAQTRRKCYHFPKKLL